MPNIDSFSEKRVTVMGLGQFGGGLGAVRFLLDRGAQVTVTDLRSEDELAQTLQEFDPTQLRRLVLGEHRDRDFLEADLIVVNPAVRPDNRFLALARRHNVPLTSEMSLFWEHCPAKKIAVTGTVGKSTTATLIHQFLLAAGIPARLGGNIGISLLPVVDSIGPDEWVVLELSSFQLSDLDRLQPRPEVAVVTNFFPNHLDWHRNLNEYRKAKQTVLRRQRSDDVAVLPGDDPEVGQWPSPARRVTFGAQASTGPFQVRRLDDSLVIGDTGGETGISFQDCSPDLQLAHQQMNLAAAVAAVTCGMGVPPSAYESVLRNFQALPHRFNVVGRVAGKTFVNDSKATTPEATIAALESCRSPVWLIAGGKDKGVDLSPLARAIAQRARGAALLGQTARILDDRLKGVPGFPVTQAASLDEAVRWTWERSRPGEVILLSPGCASDAPFTNYERRGEAFAAAVSRLIEVSESPPS